MLNTSLPFERLKQRTFCPFASSAKVKQYMYWDSDLGFVDNVLYHAVALREFTEHAQEQKFHGFASRVYIGPEVKSFEATRVNFRRYLFALALFDQNCAHCLEQEKIDVNWQFSFNYLRMFLNVFSPCYSPQHSKYIESDDSIYIFFQPEYAFDLCGSRPLDEAIITHIRDKFRSAGQEYDGELIDRRIEAHIYMFPEKSGDPPVNWWD